MDHGKKSSSDSHLTCDVCKIDFNSNADFALHEFSKKHCDNLIRLAKQKRVVSKHKTKNEIPEVKKELPKVNSVPQVGSFAKYGYFVPGEIYIHSEISREFNTDYDPYLQKYAENPFKEKPNLQPPSEISSFCSITSFSKKKKRKIKTCQVCNVTLLTLPEYEAHMKSSQHIWKLKVTGMGVSAHFVKASTDLHTTDMNEESIKPNIEEKGETPINTTATYEYSSSGPFPLLYCSDCELLLNSPQQYNAHIIGKLHIECAQRKAELKAKKEKLENPSPNQLYCYSCKILLNNLFQYNEHKNGKKHKTKCRTLVRKGITIPPEERVLGIPNPNPNKPVVYPELYEKLVLEKQKQKETISRNFSCSAKQTNNEKNILKGFAESPQIVIPSQFSLSICNYDIEKNIDIEESSVVLKDKEKSTDLPFKCNNNLEVQEQKNSAARTKTDLIVQPELKNHFDSETLKEFKIITNKGDTIQVNVPNQNESNPELTNATLKVDILQKESSADSACNETVAVKINEKGDIKNQVSIITNNDPIKCNICNEIFHWQLLFDEHLSSEDHLKKILELKLTGKSESEILSTIFSDRNFIKPNNAGKFSCSICCVTTDNSVEFEQHLNSIVHKYTQKDYRKKRTIEVKFLVASNEEGVYFCKLCQDGWTSLLDYTQHLHFVKHKTMQKSHRAKVVLAKIKNSYWQKQKLPPSVKRRNLSLRRVKTEKNPGVRTKICGVATDLHTGNQAPIPNLESLEPKIDVTKNVSIGVCNYTLGNNNDNNDKSKTPKMKKRLQMQRSNRKNVVAKKQNRGMYSFTPFGGIIPPLMPLPPCPRYPRPSCIPLNRQWAPFSSPQPLVFGPLCNRPFPMGNPCFRPQRFLRPPWPRHRPPFPYL